MSEEECDHDWKVIEDWEGDPSIPNGTRDFTYLRCTICGEEEHDHEIVNDHIQWIVERSLDI